jgi:hypothetical protein
MEVLLMGPDLTPVDTTNAWFIAVYVIYAAVSLGLTVFLARTFFRNGAVFLRDVFPGQEDVANALNHLLVVGFYLLNLGYAFLVLNTVEAQTAGEAAQTLVNRLGVLLLSLGLIHFVNIAVFWRLRRRNEVRHLPPPVAAQAWAPPPPPMYGAPA